MVAPIILAALGMGAGTIFDRMDRAKADEANRARMGQFTDLTRGLPPEQRAFLQAQANMGEEGFTQSMASLGDIIMKPRSGNPISAAMYGKDSVSPGPMTPFGVRDPNFLEPTEHGQLPGPTQMGNSPRRRSPDPVARFTQGRGQNAALQAERKAFEGMPVTAQTDIYRKTTGLGIPETQTAGEPINHPQFGWGQFGPDGKWVSIDKEETLSPVEEYEKQVGPLPQGYTPVKQSDGWKLNPQEGGPKDPDVIEQQRQRSLLEEKPKAKQQLDSALQPLERIISTIQNVKEDPDVPDIIGPIAGDPDGWSNAALRMGENNARAWSRVQNLKDLSKSMGVQFVRNASQTGSAGGQISVAEWPIFESRVANLATQTTDEAFMEEVEALEKMALGWRDRMQADFDGRFSSASTTSQGKPDDWTDEEWDALTAEEQASFYD